ncbi:hypothetical protein [Microbacterium kunmingense]|uniref:hypothetical protein n=1 Tax=Microbacterium kunmingense TaxID=2915939 RepID=UPI003D760207
MVTIRWALFWLCILCLAITFWRLTVDGVTVLGVVFYLALCATYRAREPDLARRRRIR